MSDARSHACIIYHCTLIRGRTRRLKMPLTDHACANFQKHGQEGCKSRDGGIGAVLSRANVEVFR